MRIAVSVLAILFAALHILAAVTQFKSKDPAARRPAISMASGGVCTAAMAVARLAGGSTAWMDAPLVAVGCLLVCAAAYENGRRKGKVNPLHHIVRGGVAALLVIGFAVW